MFISFVNVYVLLNNALLSTNVKCLSKLKNRQAYVRFCKGYKTEYQS